MYNFFLYYTLIETQTFVSCKIDQIPTIFKKYGTVSSAMI